MSETVFNRLLALRDETYGEFQKKLLPTVAPETIIGVRTPALRSLAKDMVKAGEADAFTAVLPHRYFDENQLHAFILCEDRVFDRCVRRVEAFLPYIDNWATCDQLSPKVFKKHREALLPSIQRWIEAKQTYTVRFSVGMLMEHFLDDAFSPAYPAMAAKIRSGEYYVNMMIAWYFATALAKQYDAALKYVEGDALDPWTRKKAIRKALESNRIPAERKQYLKTLRDR